MYSLTAADLALRFESLGGGEVRGDDWGFGCEFGFWQRHVGVEPIGLLRWASTPDVGLCAALESRFDEVCSPTALTMRALSGSYWGVSNMSYGFRWDHTGISRDVSESDARTRIIKHFEFLRTRLLEDLACGKKIFVYRIFNGVLSDEKLSRLADAVNSYGPNTLLYVRVATADYPAGTVSRSHSGLMMGYIESFAPHPTDGLIYNHDGWERVCRAAVAAQEAVGSGCRPPA